MIAYFAILRHCALTNKLSNHLFRTSTEIFDGLQRIHKGLQVSISPIFYMQLLGTQIP